MIKILIIIMLLVISNQSYGKSKCQPEWNALKAVQSQLRNKSTEYLRKKEHKKHSEYQSCRKGKNQKSTSYKKKKSYYKTSNHTQKNSKVKKYKYSKSITNKVTLKSKFSGKKQKAWLKHYRIPQDCKNPKSSSKFARCLEQRDRKAEHFEIVWRSKQR